MSGNYIKIDRNILEWEWYREKNTCRLFIHMLLKANWKDGRFKGTTVPRGSFISSYPRLSEECGLTVNELRTALKNLKSTGEITVKTHSKYSVFTVNNYQIYQGINSQIDSQGTVRAQSEHSQLTTIEEGKKGRREESITVSIDTVRQTDVQRCIDAWNGLSGCGVKPVVRVGSGSKRYKSLLARIREYGVDKVIAAIERVKVSSFLRGGGKKGWVITFDWFVLPNNFPKVLEGNYDDAEAAPKTEERMQQDEGEELAGDDWWI